MPEHQLEVLRDAEAAALRGAELIAETAREAIAARGSFALAASGGTEPWEMYRRLAEFEIEWERVEVFQVDERVAPDGDPDRNLTHLLESLPEAGRGRVRPMPVTEEDLERAAARYAQQLPDTLDLVHLGLGPDGHTASLVPGDPVLEVDDQRVAITNTYHGHRRMTLTYPELERAQRVFWLITGEEKRDPLGWLMSGDRSTPAGRVDAHEPIVIADEAAAGQIA
ncbi:MAG: 6-phosphogluconolactonase [Actinomycetota bacterium]